MYPSAGDIRLLYLKVGDFRVYCTSKCTYIGGGRPRRKEGGGYFSSESPRATARSRLIEGGREDLSRGAPAARGGLGRGREEALSGELPLRGAARYIEGGRRFYLEFFLGSFRCAGLLNRGREEDLSGILLGRLPLRGAAR